MKAARVLVAGGGLGGVETATELKRLLRDRVDVTVITPQTRFLFRPDTVYLPFARLVPGIQFPLETALARRGIGYLRGRVIGADVDMSAFEVLFDERTGWLRADYLVLATGARPEPSLLPGLEGRVLSPWTIEGMRRIGSGLRALADGSERGRRGTVLFMVPPDVDWPPPIYELTFLTHAWLRRRGVRDMVEVRFRTAEPVFLRDLGPRLHPVLARGFAQREIEAEFDWKLARVEAQSAVDDKGQRVEGDLMIAFAPYRGTATFPGLPLDGRGFLQTQTEETGRIRGRERVFVVGDAGDFPVKQGELAMLQAVSVADEIAADILGRPRERPFRADSQLILDRGDDALFLFAPLLERANPGGPVGIRPEAAHRYRVGEGWVWRPVKRALRIAVNVQLRRGRPLHGGSAGAVMDMGTRMLSRLFAR
jgi:NADH dehydrogenase FAD-containing subunit